MIELVLAMLAGALLVGIALDVRRILEDRRARRREQRSRARIRRELDRHREVEP